MTEDPVITMDATLNRPPHTFRYQGELPAKGVVGIYGRNGAGKTTFIELLAAALTGEAVAGLKGKITWPNAQMSRPGRAAVLSGEGGLFPHLTIRDNLLLAPRAHAPMSWLQRLSLSTAAALSLVAGASQGQLMPRDRDFYDELVAELGLGPHVGRFPAQLSSGEYQRAEWARALLLRPDALFLDEPFAHLDWPSRMDLLPYLAQLAARFQLPVFWISHDPHALIKGTDRIAVIGQQQLTGVFLPHQFKEMYLDL